ncbi:MAG: chromate efflux transporter [Desulfobacterota bacterium]|nr:chromate efflux transporter [Thermodesulfobacteriota bacterium]
MTRSLYPPSCRELFCAFLELGAISFGGPAIVAYMRQLVVERRAWLDDASFARGAALCQIVPGAISVQMAYYVGMQLRGMKGGCACCAGYVLAPFLFVLLLSVAYVKFRHVPASASVVRNLHLLVIALLAHAAYMFGRTSLRCPAQWALAIGSVCLFGAGLHPIAVIVCAGSIGYLIKKETHYPLLPEAFCARAYPRQWISIAGFAAGITLFFICLFVYHRQLFELGLLMCKIDLFAFGGGYTSVPLMVHEIVRVRNLLDIATLLDGIAIGQITPGPVALTATFIGYLLYGLPGAVVATVCVFLPSCIIIAVCLPSYERVLGHAGLQRIADGIVCSFVGLITWTTVLLGVQIQWSIAHLLWAGALLFGLLSGISVPLIVGAGVVGAIVMA